MKPLIPIVTMVASLSLLGGVSARAQQPAPASSSESGSSIADAQAAADKTKSSVDHDTAEPSEPVKVGQDADRVRAGSKSTGRVKTPTLNLATGIAPMPPGGPFRVQPLIGRGAAGAGKPLVIRAAAGDPKEQANLEEDLTVMAHIFDKSLEDLPGGQPRGFKAAGIDVFFAPGLSPMRTLYLDGYGAVFLLNVSFPLVPPPQKLEREKPAVDSAWAEAQEELYGQASETRGAPGMFEDYSEDKVNRLKELLFETLKNATNIRQVKADDWITVCVFGGSSSTRGKGKAAAKMRAERSAVMAKDGDTFIWQDTMGDPQARQTVLTIRVKKTEVDAYAKGKLTTEEFQKRAHATAYVSGVGTLPAGAANGFGGLMGENRF